MPNLIKTLLEQRSRVWKYKKVKNFNFKLKLAEDRRKRNKKDLSEWEALREYYRKTGGK